MRLGLLSFALLAIVPACASEDGGSDDLGSIVDGKGDAALIDVQVKLPKGSDTHPGVKTLTVHASGDFDVALTYDGTDNARITITSADGKATASDKAASPTLAVSAAKAGMPTAYTIKIENFGAAKTAHLTALGHGGGGVSPALLAAAKANLARVDKEIDAQHLTSYGLTGSLEDQFMEALAHEYSQQHAEQYAARVKALASMAFFALPDVKPPDDGKLTPFHGLDMDQFAALIADEDAVFSQLVANNGGQTNGVRPFSVCETKFIIETYVRPKAQFPDFDTYKTAYTAFAAKCDQKDLAEWYNFRGLGGLRPSWVESNLSDRFLRRMVKQCQKDTPAWHDECAKWQADRLGYRQLRNRELAARTLFYAPDQEAYLINPSNPLVFLEDRDGDNVGEFLRPGPVKLQTGEMGTLQVNSTSQFAGELKYVGPMAGAMPRSVTPAELVAESAVDPRFQKDMIRQPDSGLMTVFADSTGCTDATLDPNKCPLLRRFYSMIDRHENFYQTFSALTPTFNGISSQPSPLVACSITLGASHQWDAAGTPMGGSAGFIFLMRIPFSAILTGNDTSVATIMPGPKTTSIQSLYTGGSHLELDSAWLDVASLSNNQYETEHEISAFGAVPAGEIEGILVVRKPAAVP